MLLRTVRTVFGGHQHFLRGTHSNYLASPFSRKFATDSGDECSPGNVPGNSLDNSEVKKWEVFVSPEVPFREDQVPVQSDVLIVGGGLMGWATAFWLRRTSKYTVTLVERDPTYARSSSVLGLGSIRQQFSEPENIQMSLFTSEFLRNVKEHLSVLDETILEIGFHPQGCLLLANPEGESQLKDNYEIQKTLGARVELLDRDQLRERWSWLNTDDCSFGCYGYENEGWFDPWLLLKALRAKSHALGVNYVVGEVVGFEASKYITQTSFTDLPKRAPVIGYELRKASIALPNGSHATITFNMVVNAAGVSARDVGSLAEIGGENIPFSVPVEPRLRHIFVVRPNQQLLASRRRNQQDDSPPDTPGLDAPFIIDHNRLFVQRHGLTGDFLVYWDDPIQDTSTILEDNFELDVNYDLFHQKVAPLLEKRIPALKSAEISSAWVAPCDYNTVDQNLIIGPHPFHLNMMFCCGSSGHGAQHCVAAGRAISELIFYGHFKSIDLTRFTFDRFYTKELVFEQNVV